MLGLWTSGRPENMVSGGCDAVLTALHCPFRLPANRRHRRAGSGNESPGAAYQGDLYALAAGNILSGCRYIQPSVQAVCRQANSGPTTSVPYRETIKNFAIGYVAIDGKQALVGYTGTFGISDEKPGCMTNTNPEAILSSGRSFKALWTQSVADERIDANFYSLDPCVENGGKWYFYIHVVMHS